MAGLMLSTGLNGWAGGRTNSYTPLTPASAVSPTANISNQAYGISGSGADTWNSNTAWFGCVGLGTLAVAALVFIYWSLPR